MDVFDYIVSKNSSVQELVFIVFKEKNGYNAVESRHSLMVTAKSKSQLIEGIKRKVAKNLNGEFSGSIILREFNDVRIAP